MTGARSEKVRRAVACTACALILGSILFVAVEMTALRAAPKPPVIYTAHGVTAFE